MSLRSLGHLVRDPPDIDHQHLVNHLQRLSGALQARLVQIDMLLQPNSNPQAMYCDEPPSAVPR
jgi:hypothetical protein